MKSINYLITRVAFSLIAVLSAGGARICSAQGLPVPPVFQDLFNTLNTDLGDFNTALNGLWNGSKYPVLYAGELSNANSNNSNLLTSSALPSVQNQLSMLKALGVQAVAVEVSFPMLYEPFFSSQTEYQQYVSYYSQVATMVKQQGFKLIVESQSMIPGGNLGSGFGTQLAAFYPTLNWTQYQAARAQAAQVVAQTMQPDYFVLQEEPDTEATQTGQTNVDTVSGATSMLDQTASSVLLAGVPNMKIGAGVGTWLSGFQGFIDSYTGQQCSSTQPCVTVPLDFLDMHIFPINELGPPTNDNFWQNTLTIVSMAQAAGKPVTLSQTWLRKVRNSEWGVLSGNTQESREVFSFWEPEDEAFLQTIVNLANYSNMIFMNPWDTAEFSTYLTYSLVSTLSPGQLYSQEGSAASTALLQGLFSPTGLSYYSSIVSPPNTTPPSTPSNLTAKAASPTTVNVQWGASKDNVGVAGYYMWRDGTPLPNTILTTFKDTGLTGSTTYTYQVEAYDLGGNISLPATVSVTTPNSSPPNPPTNLAGKAVSASQINLAWTASTGIVTPATYLVFSGSSPSTMMQIQQLSGTTTSFDNRNLTPATVYYYGVKASAGGLTSGYSNIIAVSTLSLPTAPGNLQATASSATQIKLTWSASTGSLSIASYHVSRGNSSSSLSPYAVTTKTAYTDNNVLASTTYYYAVDAVDSAGDASPMSATVSATTPAATRGSQ
ncbi:MAG: fibronectin type III domain-containing protein [Bryobacteraceae bacterium]